MVSKIHNSEVKLKEGQVVVKIDPKYFRPTEVDLLIGDPTKAKNKMGWQPEYDLKALVTEMMDSDLKLFEKDRYLLDGGHQILNQAE